MKLFFALLIFFVGASMAAMNVTNTNTSVSPFHYCNPTNIFCLDWSFGNNLDIILKITARGLPATKTGGATVWVGIGFNSLFQMIGSDAIVGWVLPAGTAPVLSCRRLNAKDPADCPVSFTPCYATPANNSVSVDYGNGTVVMYISRPLTFYNKGGNAGIYSIQTAGFQTVIWAFGPNIPANPGDNLSQETVHGMFAADFVLGTTTEFLPPVPASASRAVISLLALFCLLFVMM